MKISIQASWKFHVVCLNGQFFVLCFFDICQWYETTCIIRSTKSILSGAKHKLGKAGTLNLTYQVIDIKQNSQVTYLGCILNETMSSEPMAYKIIKKINSRLNFLFRKTFLTRLQTALVQRTDSVAFWLCMLCMVS